jgi:hypothetical protein
MYTLETRYRPIPPKALPKSTETRLNNIDSQNAGPTSEPSPPIIKAGTSFSLSISIKK